MTKQTAAPIASLRIVRKRGGHLGKSQLDFVQMGRDYELSRVYPGDSQEYVYLYAKKNLPRDTVFHARVPKNHQDITQDITDPSAYEYFLRYDGENAIWTDNVLEAYEFSVPAGYFHSAWLPSVAYNPGLNVFIKMDGGRQGGNDASGEERRCQPEYPSRLRLS